MLIRVWINPYVLYISFTSSLFEVPQILPNNNSKNIFKHFHHMFITYITCFIFSSDLIKGPMCEENYWSCYTFLCHKLDSICW